MKSASTGRQYYYKGAQDSAYSRSDLGGCSRRCTRVDSRYAVVYTFFVDRPLGRIFLPLPGSSMVEHSAVNRRVASSNLARGANSLNR